MAQVTSRLLSLVRADADDHETAGILDAAVDLILEGGVKHASMTAVARRAGMSTATLHRRYAQRRDLLEAVAVRELRRFLDRLESQIDTRTSAEEQIVAMFVALCDGLRRHRLLRHVLDNEPDVLVPALTTNARPVLALGCNYIGDFIRGLQQRGQLPPYDADPIAELFTRTAVSMALMPATSVPLVDKERARRFAREHVATACLAVEPGVGVSADSA